MCEQGRELHPVFLVHVVFVVLAREGLDTHSEVAAAAAAAGLAGGADREEGENGALPVPLKSVKSPRLLRLQVRMCACVHVCMCACVHVCMCA